MSSSVNIISPKVSIRDATVQNFKYVTDRKLGLIKSLETKFTRLNSYLMGGVELNTITCISALSGAGKSTIAKCIRESLCELNKDVDFNQYIFNFEMLSHQEVARAIVTEANISLKKLYSVDEPLSEQDYEELKKHYKKMSEKDNVWFIEVPGTAQTIVDSLWHYYETECKPYNKVLVYEIDHALLTKGRQGSSEKERIDELMYSLIQFKKKIVADGGNSIGIVLSQMNRDIRDKERIKVSDLHRPSCSDLFGASSICTN